NLISVHLDKNNLESLDLSPLQKNRKLFNIDVDKTVKLGWSSKSIPKKSELPVGLAMLYQRIQPA
ncbi:MAG: hypothetical protein ACTSP3_06875, partial [Candidatus Heimdallarchaeaceae archaeon]